VRRAAWTIVRDDIQTNLTPRAHRWRFAVAGGIFLPACNGALAESGRSPVVSGGELS